MASVEKGGFQQSWRKSILNQIQKRNHDQSFVFQDLLSLHNKIFESWNALKNENIQLSIQCEKMRMEATNGHGSGNAAIAALEKKLLEQQEELTELHKKRGENAQLLVNLNEKLQNKETQIYQRDERIAELVANEALLRQQIELYKDNAVKMEDTFQVLKDENISLQLTNNLLEEKLKKVQIENREMVDRLMMYKSKDAEKMNEENENFLRKRNAKVQKELAEAARDMKCNIPDCQFDFGSSPMSSSIPNTPTVIFEAHDGEVNTVRWSPSDIYIATGGTDRKVKVWDTNKGNAELTATLVGSNAGIMSVSYDGTGSFILGTSADMAVRVWTVQDQRLRHTFTGHSNKVLAAKFFGEHKIVSGSHDRTIKFWDLTSKACTETIFAMSSCNDLVVSDSSGKSIISGHFDKKIKLWDTRKGVGSSHADPVNEILLQGKVTSLDLSSDGKTLLACVRDDSLRIIDLRMVKVISTFRTEGFVVGCDWTRATFNNHSEYVAAGSADGNIYVWNITSGKLEATLKQHTSSVTAVAWNPFRNSLTSVDKNKKAIVWTTI